MVERIKRVNARSLKVVAAILAAAALAVVFRRLIVTVAAILAQAGAAAFVLEPLARFYEKRLGRSPSALLAVLSALFILVLVALLLIPAITGPLADLYRSLPGMVSYLRRLLDGAGSALETLGISLDGVAASLQSKLDGFLSHAAGYFARTAASLARIAIVVTISFFMLRDREKLQLRLELAVPLRFRERIVKACANARRELKMYLRGQLMISLLVGALSAVGLFLVGVPAGIGLGLMAGLMNIIPYFGPIVACLPVALASLGVGLPTAVLAIAVLIAVQQIDGLIISPRIMGGVTGFSSASVIIALYAAGAAKGILGMLLALPVLILIRTCMRVFVESG
ncbi:MAG: AI-2E family transporter [Christensenellales bacterium]|jgi:predicted PurR-regulated permease PerM